MSGAFLEKATSALSEAKESVTATAETVGASLTDAQKTVAASAETVGTSVTEAQKTVGTSVTEAQKTVAATTETVKTEAAAAPDTVSTQAKDAVDNALSRGIEGAKALLHTFEEKRTEVSSKLVGAVTNAVSGASSSSTVANRDLPVSTDNQPLLASERGVETTPWWKNCCGVLDLLKTTTTKDEKPKDDEQKH